MTKGRRALRTALTVLLCLAALLAVAWIAIPEFHAGVINLWLRTTGRVTAPTVTLSSEEGEQYFSVKLPEDLELNQMDTQGGLFLYAEYLSPELGFDRSIRLVFAYGTVSTTIDTEDLLVYEEMTLGGRDVIYEEKEGEGELYRTAFVSSTDPKCFVSLNGHGVTREELLTAAESLEIYPLPVHDPLACATTA